VKCLRDAWTILRLYFTGGTIMVNVRIVGGTVQIDRAAFIYRCHFEGAKGCAVEVAPGALP
jgi:hypothetical protein